MSGTSTCTFTLGGTCCNSLTDVYDFVKKIRDEPLFAGKQCCSDGTTIDSNCSCPAAKDAAKTCIFDTCFDWPEVYELLNDLLAQWQQNNLAPLLIAGLTGIWGFFGSQGADVLPEAVPVFYSTTGGLVLIISGVLAGMWIALTTIYTGVKSQSFINVPGSSFWYYGGNSFVGDLLGFTEAVYLVGYLLLAMGTVAGSFELSFIMDRQFKKADAAKVTATNYEYLTYAIIASIGMWLGAVCINKSADLLLGFFDKQYTNAGDLTGTYAQDPDVTDLNAILVDTIHHTLTIIAYYSVAATITGGSYYYVYKAIVPADQQQF